MGRVRPRADGALTVKVLGPQDRARVEELKAGLRTRAWMRRQHKADPRPRDEGWQYQQARAQRRTRARVLAVAYLRGQRYDEVEVWNGVNHGSMPPLREVLDVLGDAGDGTTKVWAYLRAWVILGVARRLVEPMHFEFFLEQFAKLGVEKPRPARVRR